MVDVSVAFFLTIDFVIIVPCFRSMFVVIKALLVMRRRTDWLRKALVNPL